MAEEVTTGEQGTPGVDAPGNSAVEVAARKGFGPLSPMVRTAWHGDARPCVSCGQLVRRSAERCEECGEDLTASKIARMRDFAGPWFVLEHVRPFPGVTCERLVRQVRRGVLTRMTIVRGPNTDFQWRFAAETPGLCKFLGVCWSCQGRVAVEHDRCPKCGIDLGELSDVVRPGGAFGGAASGGAASGRAAAAVAALAGVGGASGAGSAGPVGRSGAGRGGVQRAAGVGAEEIRALQQAARSMPRSRGIGDDTPRIGGIRVSWIVAAIVVVLVTLLVVFVSRRGAALREQSGAGAAPVTSSVAGVVEASTDQRQGQSPKADTSAAETESIATPDPIKDQGSD